MKKNELFDAIGEVNEKYILEAEPVKRGKLSWKTVLYLAAGVMIIALSGVFLFRIAAGRSSDTASDLDEKNSVLYDVTAETMEYAAEETAAEDPQNDVEKDGLSVTECEESISTALYRETDESEILSVFGEGYIGYEFTKEDWDAFSTEEKKVNSCLPEDTMSSLSTRSLIQTVLAFPGREELLKTNSLKKEDEEHYTGYFEMREYWNVLTELEDRKDALSEANAMHDVLISSYGWDADLIEIRILEIMIIIWNPAYNCDSTIW